MKEKIEIAEEIINNGIIVKNCFKKTGQWKKDIYNDKSFSISIIDVLPKKVLKDIEYCTNEIKKNLNKYSVDTPWGMFIKGELVAEWEEENRRLYDQYTELIKKIGSKYDFIVEKIKDNCRNEIKKNKGDKLPDSSIQQIINQVIDNTPSREEFLFSLTYNFYLLKININDFEDDKKNIYINIFIDETKRNFKHEISNLAKLSCSILDDYDKITIRLARWVRGIFEKNKNINFFDEKIDRIVNDIKDVVRMRRSEIDLRKLRDLLGDLI